MRREKTPLGWGQRFREQAKAKGHSLADVAEKIGRSEPALRSWTNGTRQINLSEFLELCAAAEVDPAVVLFADKIDAKFLEIGEAWSQANANEREVFRTVAQGILARRGAANVAGGGDRTAIPNQSNGRRAGGHSRS